MISIQITGAAELSRRLNVDLHPAILNAALTIGQELRSKLAVYPGPAHHPVIWASRKQKVWWFAHRRAKGLPFGYARGSDPESQDLLHSWHAEKTPTGAVVGTRGHKGAPWVQSAEKQSAQHKATGWVTDRQAVDDLQNSGMIHQAVLQAIIAQLKMRS